MSSENGTNGEMIHGLTVRMDSTVGSLYTTMNFDENRKPREIFCRIGKAGGATAANSEAIGRLASIALQNGVGAAEIIHQLKGISSDRIIGVGDEAILSAPDAIAKSMEICLDNVESLEISE